ncbi:MAG: hypothetical protein H6622_15100 [Halobacteriovoraceae bacterium]|nr:hypothetical protein [Halobacteriovoraceae bacterium]
MSKVRDLKNKTQKKNYLSELIAAGITPLSYSIKKSYELGDFVEHPKFGKGFVESIVSEDKVQIFFNGETKMLLQNK